MSQKQSRKRHKTLVPVKIRIEEPKSRGTFLMLMRHPLFSMFGVAVAVVACVATIYSILSPELVAIADQTLLDSYAFSSVGRTVPGGFASTFNGGVWIENTSIRGGAYVKDVKFVTQSVDDALQPNVKLLNLNNEPFSSLERKEIKFSALILYKVVGQGRFKPIKIEMEFIDNNGALIKNIRTGKPYSVTIEQSDDFDPNKR